MATVAPIQRPTVERANPDTWVRQAWEAAGAEKLDLRDIPAGISEAEWDMLYKHVRLQQPYDEIGVGYSEPGSRIRQFVEAATRQLLPKESIRSEAGEFAGDTRAVSALIGAQDFYRALGSPMGGDPGLVGPFFHALANHSGAIDAVRAAIDADPVQMPSGSVVEIAPASSAEVVGEREDGR